MYVTGATSEITLTISDNIISNLTSSIIEEAS